MRGRGPVSDSVPLSTVSVTVQVLDENDNSPQFHTVSPRLIHTGHNIAASSSVAQMLATDADSGRNGNVLYHLATGTLLLIVNHTTGMLQVRCCSVLIVNHTTCKSYYRYASGTLL